jgi:hypothetical protein
MQLSRGSDDANYWQEQFEKLQREQLQTVQTAAGNWAKVVAGLLGLFAAVAFAGGLTTLDKLPQDRNLSLTPADTLVGDIKFMAVVAFGLFVVATVLVTLAAGGIFPRTRHSDSGTQLRNRSFSKAKHCLWFLRIGQAFGVAAVIVVLTGSLIVFLTPNKDAPSEPPTVIAVTDQGVRCGKVGGSAEALTVADQPLAAMPAITVVDACPGT